VKRRGWACRFCEGFYFYEWANLSRFKTVPMQSEIRFYFLMLLARLPFLVKQESSNETLLNNEWSYVINDVNVLKCYRKQ
jgi:hypothetical protein